MALAYKFYKKAEELDCKEASYKIAHFYQHGIEVERNI